MHIILNTYICVFYGLKHIILFILHEFRIFMVNIIID